MIKLYFRMLGKVKDNGLFSTLPGQMRHLRPKNLKLQIRVHRELYPVEEEEELQIPDTFDGVPLSPVDYVLSKTSSTYRENIISKAKLKWR